MEPGVRSPCGELSMPGTGKALGGPSGEAVSSSSHTLKHSRAGQRLGEA